MAKLTATVEVPFSTQGLGEPALPGDQYILEAAKRQTKIPEGNFVGPVCSYFCVFPLADLLNLQTTSGSVSGVAKGLQKKVYETVSFDGSQATVQLRYPQARDVIFAVCGKMFNKYADDTTPILVTFDSTYNSLRVNVPCIGVLQVGYNAPYDLWLATFHQSTLTIKAPPPIPHQEGLLWGPDPEDETPPTSEPMLIIGTRKQPKPDQDPDEIVCSLSLDPPDWEIKDDPTKGGGGGATGNERSMPKLKLSIDAYNPVRMMDSPLRMPIAGCGILCSPGVTPNFVLTGGSIVSSSPSKSEAVVENVIFSGGSSANLVATPVGTVSVAVGGQFVDIWGKKFMPSIGRPGDAVNVVDWIDGTTYKHKGTRVVGVDELVALDMFSNVIPCYGFVRVDYVASYSLHEYRFDFDQNTGAFSNAWVFGQHGNQTATLQLSAPNIRTL